MPTESQRAIASLSRHLERLENMPNERVPDRLVQIEAMPAEETVRLNNGGLVRRDIPSPRRLYDEYLTVAEGAFVGPDEPLPAPEEPEIEISDEQANDHDACVSIIAKELRGHRLPILATAFYEAMIGRYGYLISENRISYIVSRLSRNRAWERDVRNMMNAAVRDSGITDAPTITVNGPSEHNGYAITSNITYTNAANEDIPF